MGANTTANGSANGTTVHEAILDGYRREVSVMGDSLGVSIPAEKRHELDITPEDEVAITFSETADGHQRMEVVFERGE